MLASLYNGNVHVWNHETQASSSERRSHTQTLHFLYSCVFRHWSSLLRSQIFQVMRGCFCVQCSSAFNFPPPLVVRVAKFVVRKSWVVTGSVSPNNAHHAPCCALLCLWREHFCASSPLFNIHPTTHPNATSPPVPHQHHLSTCPLTPPIPAAPQHHLSHMIPSLIMLLPAHFSCAHRSILKFSISSSLPSLPSLLVTPTVLNSGCSSIHIGLHLFALVTTSHPHNHTSVSSPFFRPIG